MPDPRGAVREILIVAAEPGELRGIIGKCTDVSRPALPVAFARAGTLNGARITAVANGPGARLAGAAAGVPVSADAVVSAGYCGAVDPACGPGDIIVASCVGEAACEMPRTERPYRAGRLLSLDRVVTTAQQKRLLQAGNGSSPLAVDMEAAAVAAAARERGLPFFCVRAVLDAAHEGFALDFNRLRDGEGRFSRPRILAAALARPWAGIPELIRLDRRGRLCSRALGDFFAECRF